MTGGRVVSRHDCDLCGSDHFGIQCVACGEVGFVDFYPGNEPFRCGRCGADVTPTVEQVSRWNVYEFDEEIDDAHAQVMAHLRAKGMTDREAFDAADEVLAALSK